MSDPPGDEPHPEGIPQLEGDARAAVEYRGGNMQIIAGAGSGKTEVVSQRVTGLLAGGAAPESIVAFTFTERAAGELKARIERRVEATLGRAGLDRHTGLFVGTIHAYCFRLLQQRVPRYETYDVLDDNQLTAFMAREANRLDVRQLDPQGRNRMFASIGAFLGGVEVIENELLDPGAMPEPLRTVMANYFATLERYRLLTYGQQIARAVSELERAELAAEVHAELRHLIVDEYQDVNPAQERLIKLLTGPGVELCVVGDDQQAIYQWRGSDVANIVTFAERYAPVAAFEITTNRRSRPELIAVANAFAETIPDRLEKSMGTFRAPAPGNAPEIAVWSAETELDEATRIATLIRHINRDGVPFRDIAVLVRGRAAYPRLIEQFAAHGIPVQPGGRSGLFDQAEAIVLGQTYAWLTEIEWREVGPGAAVEEEALLDSYVDVFELAPVRLEVLRQFLHAWRAAVPSGERTADLVGELYELYDVLDVKRWDLGDPLQVNRLGTLARFTSLLADYESVRRRARPDADQPGEQVGGEDRGTWYYRNLALHIVNYARNAYEGFDGEPDFDLDAVDLTTVHRAKGLEWPAVFVPSMTNRGRFPSRRAGEVQDWLVPRTMFSAARYEGSDDDERRLFYVAITRARDWLSVSRHAKVTTRGVAPSPYYLDLAALGLELDSADIALPPIERRSGQDEDPLQITFSELSSFLGCAAAYRLRDLIGFQPRLAPELGYGKAIHHVLRTVAEVTKQLGRVPTDAHLQLILDRSFFLPAANKPAHRQLKKAARRLITIYKTKHEADLHRVWETERPFELHLDTVTVSGRADVILHKEDGLPTGLAIVDYKTSTDGDALAHALQLQVYADAGRREGLDVRAAYVHDLKATDRTTIPVGPADVAAAETVAADAADRIRARDYHPSPGPACRRCEVRSVCRDAEL